MLFRQILVALDRTALADRVCERGIALAHQSPAPLMLLHCVAGANDGMLNQAFQPSGIAYPWPSTMLTESSPLMTAAASEPLEPTQAQAAQQWLMQYQQKAQAAGCANVAVDVRSGQPGAVINEVAKVIDADLIVVGRRDRPGIEEFFLGSVSKAVIDSAPCEVWVVPQ